jgi:hypothetical protein
MERERLPGAPSSSEGAVRRRRDLVWPVILGVALLMVLVVNAVFIYVAVSGADEVAPSYQQGDR